MTRPSIMYDALRLVLAPYYQRSEDVQHMATAQFIFLVVASAALLVFAAMCASSCHRAQRPRSTTSRAPELAERDNPFTSPSREDDTSVLGESSIGCASHQRSVELERVPSVSSSRTSRVRPSGVSSAVPHNERVSLIAREVQLQCFVEKMERRMAEQDARIDAVQRTMLQALTTVRDTVDMLKRLEIPALAEGQADAADNVMR